MDALSTLIQLWEYIKSVFAFNPDSPLLFTQFQFWTFFALVFTFFALFRKKPLLRNTYLFFVSLLFYYKTSGLFVGLLLFVTITDFFIAQGIYKARLAGQQLRAEGYDERDERLKARLLLCLSVIIDLSILCYFKYAYFFVNLINDLFGTSLTVTNVMGSLGNGIFGEGTFSVDSIILPVGISFYTFQIISYTCDVYRGLIKPVRNFLDFGFYVSFFPQLVAGPIVKASDFVPQLYRKYNLSRMQFGVAVFWILNGLIKKLVLADYIAVSFTDKVFDSPHLFTGFENLSALFFYTLQIYGDFSGYTDVAIGLSLLMGFHLPKNFNSPYKASSCTNFWKRWHISLSRWLMNYLYIPLGGNRNITFGTYFWITVVSLIAIILCGNWWVTGIIIFLAIVTIFTARFYPTKVRKIYASLNNMVTMLLGGLWHGASLNFIVWGAINGGGMIAHKYWKDWSPLVKALICTGVVEVLFLINLFVPMPLLNMLMVFFGLMCLGAWINYICHLTKTERDFSSIRRGWSIFITYLFITFTFIFFRSGSNLDPSAGIEGAWTIASSMINSIGTQWNTNILPILANYYHLFIIYFVGLAIHWLPQNIKRRYRYSFAKLPLPVMCISVIAVVFVVYQFITADLQPFIYFQF